MSCCGGRAFDAEDQGRSDNPLEASCMGFSSSSKQPHTLAARPRSVNNAASFLNDHTVQHQEPQGMTQKHDRRIGSTRLRDETSDSRRLGSRFEVKKLWAWDASMRTRPDCQARPCGANSPYRVRKTRTLRSNGGRHCRTSRDSRGSL